MQSRDAVNNNANPIYSILVVVVVVYIAGGTPLHRISGLREREGFVGNVSNAYQ